jgi:class 3 adenylate cyclase
MNRLLSHFILEKYAQGQDAGQFPAASLFVDVAGFTTLTEALMAHGRAGSEALAALMSACSAAGAEHL